MWRAILAAAVVAAWAPPVRAATYTVCASGCDADCAGLSALVASLLDDDVVEFQEGCTGVGVSSPVKSRLQFLAVGSITMDGNGAVATAFKVHTDAVVDGFTITGYTGVAIDALSTSARFYIRDNHITGGTGCVAEAAAGSIIERNLCAPTSGRGLSSGTASATFRNNVVVGSTNVGIYGTNATCTHNTVTGVTGGTYAMQCGAARFNIILSNSPTSAGVYAPTEQYNLAYGNTPANCSGGCDGTTLVTDPELVLGGDFHLTATSPAIDAATGSTETVDHEATARDATPDIGAYEYVAPPVTGSAKWVREGQSGCLLCNGSPGYLLFEGAK